MVEPTVISTFAGAGGSSLGYQLAGFRELLAIEWDNNAVKTFRLNFPDVSVYHGDIAKLTGTECMKLAGIEKGQLDILDGSPPCFPKGTLITTKQYIIPIDLITPDMKILTHRNQFRRVKKVNKREYLGNLIKIKMKYGREDISCTPDHQFFARQRFSKTRDCKNRKNGSKYKAYSNPQWIKAQDLNIGDVLLEPHILEVLPLEILKIIKKQRINKVGQSGKEISETQLIESDCCIDWRTNAMAWLLGFYLAEGHLRGNNPMLKIEKPCRREVIFSVNEKEAIPIANKLQDLNLNSCIQNHGQGGCRVTVTSIDFWALCSVIGKYADGKYIPAAFHTMSIEWQKEFIDGYFTGDGCYIKKGKNSFKRKATTASLSIVQGMTKMIAKVFGVVASVDVLYFAGKSVIMGKNVTVKDTYSISFTLKTLDRIRPGFVDKSGQWIPIKAISVITSDKSIDVYNLEIDEDQSYIANNFAVHNCQGFSLAGKRKFNDPRNSLFKEYARLLNELQPKVFVMENVTGMVKGYMKQVYLIIIKTLRECGYKAKGEILNAKYFNVPQSRERVIIIGVREDLGIEPSHPKPQNRPTIMRKALDGLKTDTSEAFLMTPRFIKPLLRKMKDYESASKYSNGIRYFNHSRNSINRSSRTISRTPVIYHHKEERLLTREELKIIASFPLSFQFVGNLKEHYNCIGNSVPPNLMKAIADHIKTNILR